MRIASLGQLHLFRRGFKPIRPPKALEFETACAFADTLRRFARDDWIWTHFPAGELRSKATGARLKRMGLRAGVADYLFISPATGQAYFLELKRGNGPLSEAQAEFRDWCHAHRVPWHCARSYDDAIATVTAWGVLRLEGRPQ